MVPARPVVVVVLVYGVLSLSVVVFLCYFWCFFYVCLLVRISIFVSRYFSLCLCVFCLYVWVMCDFFVYLWLYLCF